MDLSISEGTNFIGGANEDGYHLLNVCYGRDFHQGELGDFAQARSGFKAVDKDSRLKEIRGIEIGNIFKLGTKFTQSMQATYLDEEGKQQTPTMGCYGIGIGRLMASVVENSHDENGPIWPKEIAPFQVHLLNIGKEEEVVKACEKLHSELEQSGFDVIFDDRDERPGVKFKDADLWGIPVRIAISKKTLAEGQAEWKLRSAKDFEKCSLEQITNRLKIYYSL